ncbi:PREDICTED: uncharacterized protein LOC105456655, partial [Wasmannia auropunctata]|uniref:uncharacterized protein LOC105456655 n=1 Tax=Wasmannia auropunctata TaxID=64793 RepID=UPI0005EF37DA
RVNRFLKSTISKLIESPDLWALSLHKAQYVVNNTVHSSTTSTPSKLMLGYDKRNHTDHKLKDFLDSLAEIDNDIINQREKCRDTAVEATHRIQAYNKLYYDKRHRKPTQYKEGEYVMICDTQNVPGASRKFKSNYKGPYLISKTLNNNRYVVTDIPGFSLSSRAYNTILSPDRLKPWIKPSN